jgi:uncharacterized membrane protein HdeD (DUF308 family)
VNTFTSTDGALMTTRRGTGWSIFMGIILMVAGFAAIWIPFAAGLASTIFFGCLVLFSGIAHWVYAWFGRNASGVLWQILIGLVYVIAGATMLLLPVNAVFALTLVLACYIAIEGVFEIVFFSRLRLLPGSAWFLVDGIISLLLSVLIFVGWPSSSLWALGTLVGVSLLFSGVARLTLSMMRPSSAIA